MGLISQYAIIAKASLPECQNVHAQHLAILPFNLRARPYGNTPYRHAEQQQLSSNLDSGYIPLDSLQSLNTDRSSGQSEISMGVGGRITPPECMLELALERGQDDTAHADLQLMQPGIDTQIGYASEQAVEHPNVTSFLQICVDNFPKMRVPDVVFCNMKGSASFILSYIEVSMGYDKHWQVYDFQLQLSSSNPGKQSSSKCQQYSCGKHAWIGL